MNEPDETSQRTRLRWARELNATWRRIPRPVRQVSAAAAGGAFILAGGLLLVLPGPGLAVIALGLAVLATEFPWARRLLQRAAARVRRALRARSR
jgi:UPF0716 family protein affecting phage T7 exclusion